MIVHIPEIKTPSRSSQKKIWKYTDFTKFVEMLSSGSLFFCRADLLGDNFEGSLPTQNHDKKSAFWDESLKDNKHKDLIIQNLSKKMRETFAVNCWHQNDYESAAMWKLYLKSNEGIAI